MQNRQPYFSVIIPTLNEEKYVSTLITCLKKQTFQDFEIIVVDGKSQDKTIEVLDKIRTHYPKLNIILSDKTSVSFQRNLGAKQAIGEYLIFFDADGQFGQNYLAKIHDYILKFNSTLLTTWLIPDSKHLIDRILVFLANIAVELARYTNKAYLCGANIIVKKNIFWQIGGFDEKVVYAEDHVFAHKAGSIGIKLELLKNVNFVFSMRRLRHEGRFTVIKKYLKVAIYLIFKGPIKKNLFEYKMGGGS